MKHKFKVGDRVRIRQWDDMAAEFGVDENGSIRAGGSYDYTPDMKPFCGKLATIDSLLMGLELYNFIDCDEFEMDEWGFETWMLEHADCLYEEIVGEQDA